MLAREQLGEGASGTCHYALVTEGLGGAGCTVEDGSRTGTQEIEACKEDASFSPGQKEHATRK